MAENNQVYDPIIYELASLGRDELGYEIKGETMEEIQESLLAVFNTMDNISAKAKIYRQKESKK